MTESSDAVSTTRATYDIVAKQFCDAARRLWPSLLEDIDDLFVRLPAAPRILDVGCGSGRDMLLLRDRGAEVVGLDLSAGMLRTAGLAGVVQADMRRLPVRTGVLDGVWSQAALLHVPRADVPAALAEFRRVLAPTGLLHLVVSEGEGQGWEVHRYGSALPRWFVHHSEEKLRELLNTAGFDVLDVRRLVAERNWLRLRAASS